MSKKETTKYWLFQSNPKIFRLRDALAAEALLSFAIKSHKKSIKKGDKIILWQSGKNAGCYALATALNKPEKAAIPAIEKPFFLEEPASEQRISLKIDYNLWNRPITKEIVPNSGHFRAFYAGLPGTNFKATKAQYKELIGIVESLDLVHEPAAAYRSTNSATHPLNLILQGPPGTGKTYQTVNYALSIIENRTLKELTLEPRNDLRQRFAAYQEEGRIQFITFHQSYSYEDFVEGIKPFSVGGQIQYGIESGIFKQICLNARRCLVDAMLQFLPRKEIHLEFNQLYRSFLDYLKSDHFTNFIAPDNRKILLHKVLRFGNLSVREGKSFSVFNISKNKLQKLYEHFPNLNAIQDVDKEVRTLLGSVNTHAYWGVFSALKNIEGKLLEQEIKNLQIEAEEIEQINIQAISDVVLKHCRKYVLIIDEINRGNISSIFGELISLLEGDKREGRSEATSTVLPYSKEPFAVPPNLHIIGTMNTRDRSTDAMDIALRRRFSFVEMPPTPALLRPAIEAGVNLEKLLTAINQRIEALLDKEHLIGHAYLMEVHTLDDLIKVFHGKIIPLLQTYFFGDLNKLGLVLGKQFFKQIEPINADLFSDFDADFVEELAYKKLYELKDHSEWKEPDFIRVYDKEY